MESAILPLLNVNVIIIYKITEHLSKHFIVEVGSNISTFAIHMEDEGGDIALINDLKQVLRSMEKSSWIDVIQTEAIVLTKSKTWTLAP